LIKLREEQNDNRKDNGRKDCPCHDDRVSITKRKCPSPYIYTIQMPLPGANVIRLRMVTKDSTGLCLKDISFPAQSFYRNKQIENRMRHLAGFPASASVVTFMVYFDNLN